MAQVSVRTERNCHIEIEVQVKGRKFIVGILHSKHPDTSPSAKLRSNPNDLNFSRAFTLKKSWLLILLNQAGRIQDR